MILVNKFSKLRLEIKWKSMLTDDILSLVSIWNVVLKKFDGDWDKMKIWQQMRLEI